ncbi:uncharacterized protein F5147DRAFT_771312 [Suillus discolor]|uniref:Uncharacterized protein n=1 Tax=Suillus discolor TaxID=1912936 RepID=A0A9P7JWD3_9AGAM|nr:uncharacterized protein F5147DRAFT_771312 [Suillus discolor]KAG2112250.1 hypothetical protein F5147DRAFT_771312 [Suillus discolor]
MGLCTSLCSITNDLSATVKLIGWTHPQWVNPSDLKGGIESLENFANAIASGTCHFVPISSEELEDHLQHMKNGEKLTPEVKPSMPIELTCSSSPDTPQLPTDTDPSLSSPSTAESLSANILLRHSSDLDSTPPNSLPPASNSVNESSTPSHVGISRGMGNPWGSWVGVPRGMGMGRDLGTHGPNMVPLDQIQDPRSIGP